METAMVSKITTYLMATLLNAIVAPVARTHISHQMDVNCCETTKADKSIKRSPVAIAVSVSKGTRKSYIMLKFIVQVDLP